MKSLILAGLIVSVLGSSARADDPRRLPQRAPNPRVLGHAVSRPHDPATVPSMTGWNINVADAVEIGGPWSVKIVGNLAYVGYGGMLSVLDITNPTAPVRLGFALLNGGCLSIRCSASHLYCITQDYPDDFLQVVDVSNPSAPLVVQTLSIQGEAMDIQGNYLYLEQGDNVRIYDISTPATPQVVGSFASSRISDIVATNGYIYVGRGSTLSGGLQIMDATNPIAPVQLSLLAITGGAYSVDVTGPYVYVYVFFSQTALNIVDASNPSAPVVVKVMPLFESADLAIDGTHAYALDFDGFLRTFDITNAANPIPISTFSPCNFDYASTLDVNGGLVAIGAGDGVCLVDVSNPASPISRGQYESLPSIANADVAGDYLALSTYWGSLVMMNRDETSLRYQATGSGWYIDWSNIAVQGNYAYVSMCDSWGYAEDDGLEVFDLTDPTNPARVGLLPSTWCPRGVSLGASHAYFAPYGKLWVADISNPTLPTKTGELSFYVRDQVVAEPYLYCVTDGGLTVVDVANASVPSVVGSISLAGDLENVCMSGDFVYVSALHELWIVDVSNPLQPSLAGSFPTTSSTGMRVEGQYLYLSDRDHFRILDISDPTDPTEVGNIQTVPIDLNSRVAVGGQNIYAVTYDGPLLIFQTQLVSDVAGRSLGLSLQQNYPNPFNPSTTIAFETPANGHVRLDVFDVRGQLVRHLVDESMPAGAHSIVWDGRASDGNVARSGVYFCRLEANGRSEARKMVILK